jgi:hypothetical protein
MADEELATVSDDLWAGHCRNLPAISLLARGEQLRLVSEVPPMNFLFPFHFSRLPSEETGPR